MAGNDTTLASVGKPVAAGALYYAPIETTVPVDATTALPETFIKLGYCSDDGLESGFDDEKTEINAWGGDLVISVRKSRKETQKFTLLQTLDIDVQKFLMGDANVTGTADAFAVKHNNIDNPRVVWVAEIAMTGGRVRRIVVGQGQVSELESVKYSDGDAVGHGVTLACFPDSDGNTAVEYTAKIVVPTP